MFRFITPSAYRHSQKITMFQCYKCGLSFSDVNVLINHFKIKHKHDNHNQFICKQDNCSREFQNIHSFKRHLTEKHSKSTTAYATTSSPNIDLQLPNSIPITSKTVRFSENPAREDILSFDNSVSAVEHKIALSDSALKYASHFYSKCSLTRENVQDILDTTTEFIRGPILNNVRTKVMETLNKAEISREDVSEIEAMFDISQKPFLQIESDYKRMKAFEESTCYIKPTSYFIGDVLEGKYVNKVFTLVPGTADGQEISIKKVLRKLFEMPLVLDSILAYMKLLSEDSERISNIIQGALFKSICLKFPGKFFIPVLVYFDEWEANNPLGSHAGVYKMGSTYFSLACVPPEFKSKLENIFLALIFLNSDFQEHGTKATFAPLIKQFKKMEEKPIFQTADGIDIYVCLLLFIGDNLGVHEVTGFVKSFSANHPCRMCTIAKNVLHHQTTEDESLLRTVEGYDENVQQNDVSKTGISEKCIFNELKSFHVLRNLAFDIMHDIGEGVIPYDMSDIILGLIEDSKLFTLEEFNNRLGGFDFGLVDSGNRSKFLTTEKLKVGNLGFSASEQFSFLQYFGLIIGDKVPVNNKYWGLYTCLCEIVTILRRPSFKLEDTIHLKNLVTKHHELYLRLFNKTLKPKHHFMVHYHRIMLEIGPLVHVWCMRYEAKHKEGKIGAHVITSRRNLPLTLAKRHQLKMCDRFLNNRGFSEDMILGRIITDNVQKSCNFTEFKLLLPTSYTAVSWIEIKSVKYKENIVVDSSDLLGDVPIFSKIEFICIDDKSQPFFIVRAVDIEEYSSHLNAYKIKIIRKWLCLPYKNITYTKPSSIITDVHGDTFIVWH